MAAPGQRGASREPSRTLPRSSPTASQGCGTATASTLCAPSRSASSPSLRTRPPQRRTERAAAARPDRVSSQPLAVNSGAHGLLAGRRRRTQARRGSRRAATERLSPAVGERGGPHAHQDREQMMLCVCCRVWYLCTVCVSRDCVMCVLSWGSLVFAVAPALSRSLLFHASRVARGPQ